MAKIGDHFARWAKAAGLDRLEAALEHFVQPGQFGLAHVVVRVCEDQIALSRWCGIVRWFLDERPLAEFVYDTTDILRETHRHGAELIRAVVCLDAAYRPHLNEVATALGTVCV